MTVVFLVIVVFSAMSNKNASNCMVTPFTTPIDVVAKSDATDGAFNNSQYQKMIAYIQCQIACNTISNSESGDPILLSMPFSLLSFKPSPSSPPGIVDTRATTHISCRLIIFPITHLSKIGL